MRLDHIAVETRKFMDTDAFAILESWIAKQQDEATANLCDQSPLSVDPARVTMERQRIADMRRFRKWFDQLSAEIEVEAVDE